jgi:NlpC/P60 family putative phage cell wall peptidase
MYLKRSDIVAAARGWLGTPYRHQASLKGVGCDCLGLVRGVWRDCVGAEPERAPPYAADWAEAGAGETLLEAAERHLVRIRNNEMRAGDVVLFRWRAHLPAKHAGLLASPIAMIHAQEGVEVCEVPLGHWWQRHMAGVFRFPGVKP